MFTNLKLFLLVYKLDSAFFFTFFQLKLVIPIFLELIFLVKHTELLVLIFSLRLELAYSIVVCHFM